MRREYPLRHFFRKPGSRNEPGFAQFARRIHDDQPSQCLVSLCLHEKGRFINKGRGPAFSRELFELETAFARDVRMKDFFEIPSRGRILKNDLAQLLPIGGSESALDLLMGRSAWHRKPAGKNVGIDHRESELREKSRGC